MDARLLFMGTVVAAMAGGLLAAVLVGGPPWLVVPGLLGAALPAVAARARSHREEQEVSSVGRAPADPS